MKNFLSTIFNSKPKIETVVEKPAFLKKKSKDIIPLKEQDWFLRVYPRLLRNPNLTLLEKLIMSDIISFQLKGQLYFKTSRNVGDNLGVIHLRVFKRLFRN